MTNHVKRVSRSVIAIFLEKDMVGAKTDLPVLVTTANSYANHQRCDHRCLPSHFEYH